MSRFIRLLLLGAALTVLPAIAVPVMVSAQEQEGDPDEAEDPAESRSAEFRAMEGPDQESVPGGPLMIAAYAFVWVLLLLYIVRLGQISARTGRDVARLERSLSAAAASEPDAAGDEKDEGAADDEA